jgi:hypothetical protein
VKKKEDKKQHPKADKLDLYLDNKDEHINESITKLGKEIGLVRIEQKIALKVVLFNLFWAQGGRLITPRARTSLGVKRYNPHKIGYKGLRTVLDSLIKNEYITQDIGYKDFINDESVATTIISTPKLSSYLHNHNWNFSEGWSDSKSPEFVILRDNTKNKKLVDYDDTKYSNWLRGELTKYNRLLNEETEILLVKHNTATGEEEIVDEYYDLTLQRKFIQHRKNEFGVELSYGGRMYAPWCNLSSNQRKMITINGDKTVELDLEASSVNVIYMVKTGKRYPDGDPYKLIVDGELIPRHIVKQGATIMLNTKSINGAVAALENHYLPNVFDDKRSKKALKKADEYRSVKLRIKPSVILRAFLDKHKLIKDSFLKGRMMGDLVACQESDRVFEIVRRFTANNVPILTVYDSFIVQEKYKDNLQKWMDKLLPLRGK